MKLQNHRLLTSFRGKFVYWPLLAVFLVALSSCSTKKNTVTSRTYHRITAKYNTYFNGYESLREGTAQLLKSSRENYSEVLPIYNFGSFADAASLASNMDRASQKAGKVAQKHSMVFKKQETNKWVMRSYLLIGIANFYKQDFAAARRAFDFVARQYEYDPIHYEAKLWLGRTHAANKEYERAISEYDGIVEQAGGQLLPWFVRKNLPLSYADINIARKNYTEAIADIESALPLNRRGKLNTRLNYILGQLHFAEGNYQTATDFFERVAKKNPDYEMAFNARMNIARAYVAGSGSSEDIQKTLQRMLKDSKNKEYKDQIYFALAEIALKNGEREEAIGLLRNSVASSEFNDFQKTGSSLKVANLLFEDGNHIMSKAYYDTALTSMPRNYPDFEKAEANTQVQVRLLEQLSMVQVQDSLQRLAAMPEDERNALIDKLIEDYNKQQEELKKLENLERASQRSGMGIAGYQFSSQQTGETQVAGGGWYFYNPTALSMGLSEFTRKWGRRRLEDNWRLSNKRETNLEMTTEEATAELVPDSVATEGGLLTGGDLADRNTYLRNIPLTAEAKLASNKNIEKALYNAGLIYMEELTDLERSDGAFKRLVNDYPENPFMDQSVYYLYRIAEQRGDMAAMELYKNQIIAQNPQSDFARLLVNPEYREELLQKTDRLKSLYEETYQAFDRQMYRAVVLYSEQALASTNDPVYVPRFSYLKAIAKGKLNSPDTMNLELRDIVTKYPASEVANFARILLGEKMSTPGDTTQVDAAEPVFADYVFNENSPQFYVLMLDADKVNISGTRVRINDFNAKNFPDNGLQVNSILLDGTKHLVTVGVFPNVQEALDYFSQIGGDTYVFSGIREGEFEHFIISGENYPAYNEIKNTDTYLQFFNKHYLRR